MKLRSYAKINIGLRVVGKRPDGLHNIETIYHVIDLFDELSLEAANDVTVHSNIPSLDADPTNLCVRAANLLRQTYGVTDGVRMVVNKQIPLGAGLGGGSSNAAATLRGLNKLWNLAVPDEELQRLALSLGSDVPFFIHGGTAFAQGRGEILESLNEDNPYVIAIVSPSIHVSTAWAYGALDLSVERNGYNLRDIFRKFLRDGTAAGLENDFERIVFARYPEIGAIKASLLNSGAIISLMSGSGASVWGFFPDDVAATAAMARFPKSYRTFLTRPLVRHVSEVH